MKHDNITVIKKPNKFSIINFLEIWSYKDLIYSLLIKDIKVRYAQSVLGLGWAVIQPLFFMVVFTLIFSKLAKVSTEGKPAEIFYYSALVPWTYFASGLIDSTGSLIQNSGMMTKVYFPRIILPMVSVLSKLPDLIIASTIVAILMIWFSITPSIYAILIPLFIVIMVLFSFGLGAFFSALAIQYRDIKYGITFLTQILMFATPIAYPTSLIPNHLQWIYALNPMVGVIEGMRSCLLQTREIPIDFILIGFVVSIVTCFIGVMYFNRCETTFADVA
tara:strand:+ start:1154 stop:1981 length:828 start_codon:yes stop_codon:yes gene_type:complete